MSTNLKLPKGCFIQGKNFILSEEMDDNILNIDGKDYAITNYIPKGGNSYILFLSVFVDDEIQPSSSLVMKINKFPIKNTSKRFEYEIKALTECKKQNIFNIIEILNSGKVKIKRRFNKNAKFSYGTYYYYTMEYAEEDLTQLIETKRLELIDKIELCLNITKAFKQLHEVGYYHRDIKSDNILFCNGELRIGDLGLAEHQDIEKSFDIKNEKIGPYGWLSPEVMNKVLTEKKELEFSFDCKIDFKSDIFQLGKMFWYVFQANLPIGSLESSDFEIKDEQLFILINDMLQNSKSRRPELDIIENRLLAIHATHTIPN